MTIAEFNEYNRTNTMPCDGIGQGFGYKAESWNNDNEIIYIPEYAYEEDDNCIPIHQVDRKNAYSMNDLVKLIPNYLPYRNMDKEEQRAAAEALFYFLDWQFPETALEDDEREYLDELDYEYYSE
jgi:hypothetical protein